MTKSSFLVLGFVIRFTFILAFVPQTYEEWFVPFLQFMTESNSVDVWRGYLDTGGDPASFPYGWIYLLFFAPGVLLGWEIGGLIGAQIFLGLTVLLLDFCLLKVVERLAPIGISEPLTFFYWLSPITIYIGYWHGQLDVLPTFILGCSLLALKQRRFQISAILLALSVAAKLSMVVAVPFIFLYLYGSRRYHALMPRYLVQFFFALSVSFLPFLLLPGFNAMVLGTSELGKSVALGISYREGMTLYALPMVYALLLFLVWRIRRFNFEELLFLISLAFLLLYVLTPASPGWAMWFAAFLSIHTAMSQGGARVLYIILNLSFLALHLLISSGSRPLNLDPSNASNMVSGFGISDMNLYSAMLFSLLTVCAAAIAFQMLRDRIFMNSFHRSTRTPLLIGVAGDSGTGKDTLSESISAMFGKASVSAVSGDDYHNWDRHKPMWRAMTHLNPKANDLSRFISDIIKLRARIPIRSRHYDHSVGRMTKPLLVKPREIIVASGLHTLYSARLVEHLDLKIFLGMNERLRRYFKIRRDVTVRGHPIEKVERSIADRAADGVRYIQPQMQTADIVMSLEPMRLSDVDDYKRSPDEIPLRLRVAANHGHEFQPLVELLVSICGLYVFEVETTEQQSEFVIEGSPTELEVELVAARLAPEFDDFLSLEPEWQAGQLGLMQLVILNQLEQLRLSRGA